MSWRSVPSGELRCPVARAALISVPGVGWAALAHEALGIPLGSAAALAALSTVAAFGIGYEIGDGGTAVALFLALAGGGVLAMGTAAVSDQAGVADGLLFTALPSLVAAPGASAGGALRERRSHPPIAVKEVVET